MREHIKFLFDDNQPMELLFLSKASKYLGVVKLGDKQVWKYLKTRFMRLSSAATPEQLLQFIEGVKKRGEKLTSYGSFVDLMKDIDQNFDHYDFSLKTYVMEIGLILEKD